MSELINVSVKQYSLNEGQLKNLAEEFFGRLVKVSSSGDILEFEFEDVSLPEGIVSSYILSEIFLQTLDSPHFKLKKKKKSKDEAEE